MRACGEPRRASRMGEWTRLGLLLGLTGGEGPFKQSAQDVNTAALEDYINNAPAGPEEPPELRVGKSTTASTIRRTTTTRRATASFSRRRQAHRPQLHGVRTRSRARFTGAPRTGNGSTTQRLAHFHGRTTFRTPACTMNDRRTQYTTPSIRSSSPCTATASAPVRRGRPDVARLTFPEGTAAGSLRRAVAVARLLRHCRH
jgi:hypothetical protein